ncbi:MAG: M23 family metallopeptidase [Chloroflexota bacterium]|nr:M23 family metallopeptidase [Chloroflexota bacterium]
MSRVDVDWRSDIRPFAGNYIIIESDGVYIFLAHLKEGSLTVKVGDSVEPDPLGRVSRE